MIFLRGLLCVAGIACLMACVWALTTGDFVAEFKEVAALPWGKIALVDVYFGLILFAIIIFAFEPIWFALPVVALLLVFGNWVAAFWLALRLPKIIRKLRGVA